MRGRPHRASPAVAVVLLLALLRLLWPINDLSPPIDHLIATGRSPSLLILISSSDPERVTACMDSWLRDADGFFIFTRVPNNALNSSNHVIFRLWSENDWFLIRSQTVFAQLALPTHADWIAFAHDDTFVLLDELRQDLSAVDADEPQYASIGTFNFEKPLRQPANRLVVVSRGGLKLLAKRIQRRAQGCEVTGSLEECLHDVTKLSLEIDAHKRYRYQIVNRHFDSNEMKHYSRRYGTYTDGEEVLSQLSPSLLSLHNLNVDDIRIFHTLLNRVRVWKTALL